MHNDISPIQLIFDMQTIFHTLYKDKMVIGFRFGMVNICSHRENVKLTLIQLP